MIFWPTRKLVAVLERELAYFKAQYERERTRAENAIDELLALKTDGHVAPVTRPSPLPVPPSIEEIEAARAAEIEMDAVGRV